MGIPNGAKFVCLLVRDQKYLNSQYSESNWDYHNYRDADIDNYKKAALYLAENGFYVLRMGKCVDKAFDVGHSNVIDYANHELRSDFMDIYLAARCYFYISTLTGLDAVALAFRRPVLFTDCADTFCVPRFYPAQLFIPKKIIDSKTGRYLAFLEMVHIFTDQLNLGKNVPEIMCEANIEFIANTDNEILNAVKEMISQLHGDWSLAIKTEILQKEFWSQYPTNLIDYRTGISFHGERNIRVGSNFLVENKDFSYAIPI